MDKNINLDVDGDAFFESIMSELLNEEVVLPEYTFERYENELRFYGNVGYCYITTKVINDNQLRDYYEILSDKFNGDVNEFDSIGIWGGECDHNQLYAIINDRIINIKSDNPYDSWIYDKIWGRDLTLNQQI